MPLSQVPPLLPQVPAWATHRVSSASLNPWQHPPSRQRSPGQHCCPAAPHGPHTGAAFGMGQAKPGPVQKYPVGPMQQGWPEAPQSEQTPEEHAPPDMQAAPGPTQRRLSQHPPDGAQLLPAQQA